MSTLENEYRTKFIAAQDVEASMIEMLNRSFWIELTTWGQLSAWLQAQTIIPSIAARLQIAKEFWLIPWKYVQEPLIRRYSNSIYMPLLPDISSIAALRKQDIIPQDEYEAWANQQGFATHIADKIGSGMNKWPGPVELIQAVRRGIISEELSSTLQRRQLIQPMAQEIYKALSWQLPAVADLISIYMREGYLTEKWVEIPEGYLKNMEQQGFSQEWATQIWGKHWVLPGVNLLYEMFWKKIITLDDMTKMLKYHDFEPVWRQRLIDNAYNMIPRVDLRRAYRYGMLTAESLQERYEGLGYKTSDAEIMSGIATRTSLDRYYTRYETVARSAFRKGKLSETEFKSILERINTPTEAISLTLESEKLAAAADVREVQEESRILTASQICSLYRERLFTREVALTRLTGLGYQPEDAALLLSLSEPRPPAPDVNTDLVSAAATLYREGLMSADEFRGRLRKAGLSEEGITAKLEAEELRYRLDYARDLIALVKQAYAKDVYTLEELEGYLLDYGMQYDRVKAIAALEELRKLPKPKRAA